MNDIVLATHLRPSFANAKHSSPGRSRQICPAPGLGYRGLNLTIAQGPRTSNWRVFADCIEHDGQSFDDAKQAVEAYVLESIPAKLKSDLSAILPHVSR
jgi:hypothetical protein